MDTNITRCILGAVAAMATGTLLSVSDVQIVEGKIQRTTKIAYAKTPEVNRTDTDNLSSLTTACTFQSADGAIVLINGEKPSEITASVSISSAEEKKEEPKKEEKPVEKPKAEQTAPAEPEKKVEANVAAPTPEQVAKAPEQEVQTPPPAPEQQVDAVSLPAPVVEPQPEPTKKAKLTASRGTFNGPSGKETWYNLDMSGVINIMRKAGFSEEEYPYWVREDGCKMLGNYIMLAQNTFKIPRGTIMETSLGLGMVCDHCVRSQSEPNIVDLAVNW